MGRGASKRSMTASQPAESQAGSKNAHGHENHSHDDQTALHVKQQVGLGDAPLAKFCQTPVIALPTTRNVMAASSIWMTERRRSMRTPEPASKPAYHSWRFPEAQPHV